MLLPFTGQRFDGGDAFGRCRNLHQQIGLGDDAGAATARRRSSPAAS